MVGGGVHRAPGPLAKSLPRVQVRKSTWPSPLPTLMIMNTKSWFLDIPSRLVGDRVVGSWPSGLRHRRDRHQPQRRPGQCAGPDRPGRGRRLRRRQVPEAHARDLHPARPVGHRAGHPVGPDDATSTTGTGSSSARTSTRPIDEHARRARHRLVRLALGRRVGRLPGAVRRAGPQGGFGLPDRRRAAAAAAGHRPHRSSCPPACPPCGRSGTRSRCWAATTSCSATPPAPIPAPAGELNLRMIHTLQGEFPNVPDRLLRPRDRAADHAGRGRPGRGLRRAAHHPGPGHVGLGSGGLDRAAGSAAAGPRHPGHLRGPGRRGQAGLRRRAGGDEEAAPGARRARRRAGQLVSVS